VRRYRAYADAPLAPGAEFELSEDEAHHLSAVRRVRSGDAVIVVNGGGLEAEGILRTQGKRCSVAIERITRELLAPPPRLRCACALTKSSAFEDILQRAVELGMTHYQPLMADRSVVELDERRAEKKREKWTRHGIEALKQCERLWLPEIGEPTKVADFLRSSPGGRVLLLEERSPEAPPLAQLVPTLANEDVTLLIGPEGGWSDAERALARTSGCQPTSLGEVILRAETAWLASLALLGR
jgi:16S rRNA (uracil1498-N3)-methyltransferase